MQGILQEHLPAGFKVWVFGSRADWSANDASDLDLAVEGHTILDHKKMTALLFVFEESILPYGVDVVDLNRISSSFKQIVESQRVSLPIDRDKTKQHTPPSSTPTSKATHEETPLTTPPGKWSELQFSKAVLVNPVVHLDRGKVYPFVSMAAVNADYRSVHPCSQREFQRGGSKFQSGDTLMARITPSLENGKIACYHAPDPISRAHGSTEFIVFRGRPGVTDNNFIYYLTLCDKVREYAISQMSGTSGRQRVPVNSLDHLIVPIPPLPEQRAIAHILGTLDDKIELNRRISETLEETAKALFKSWFIDFDPVRAKMKGRWRQGESLPGLPANLYDLFPSRLVDSGLGPIPDGWQVRALDEIATFLNGLALQKYPPTTEDSLPIIKIKQLKSSSLKDADLASSNIDPKYIVDDGDILFSWSGSLECRFWISGCGALNQHLFKVIPIDNYKWFCYFAIHRYLNNFRAIAAGKATTMGHIQRQHLSDAKQAVPSHDILNCFDSLFSPVVDRIVESQIETKKLILLRNVLLPRLVSGELDVSNSDLPLKALRI